ncbi:MAG: Gfo/Idh/MocA family oxidoreductase [Phycisphaerales bacterium]|nr:Gfo/Idh/MocA family oxidoreductase [Phycisphaerales bacterium]
MNIALVGCGGMAKVYRRRYTEIEGARLAVLVDISEETVKTAAEELSVTRYGTDFNLALASDIDIVDISTPNQFHAAQAIAALAAGKHVIIQKPLTPTVREGEAICAAAKQYGKQAGMYMGLREEAVFDDLKIMTDTGKLGRVASIRSRMAHRGGLTAKPQGWRASLEKTGGGSFIQLAVHHVNIIQYILSARIVRVFAFSNNVMCPNIGGDDITMCVCEFDNGVQGVLESSYCSDGNSFEIYGSQGYVQLPPDNNIMLKLDSDFSGQVLQYSTPGKIARIKGPGRQKDGPNPLDQHVAFVTAMMQGKPAPVSAEMGLYDLRVVDAVYRSANMGALAEVV